MVVMFVSCPTQADDLEVELIAVRGTFNQRIPLETCSVYGLYVNTNGQSELLRTLITTHSETFFDLASKDSITEIYISIDSILFYNETSNGAVQEKKPLLLFKANQKVKEGAIEQAFFGSKHLLPGERIWFKMYNKFRFGLTCFGNHSYDEFKTRKSKFGSVISNYGVMLIEMDKSKQVKEQFILRYSSLLVDQFAAPSLIWAGDINGDGVIDMLWNVSTGETLAEYHLYMSPMTNSEYIVIPVGKLVVGME